MASHPPGWVHLRQGLGRKMLNRLSGRQRTEPFRWFQDPKEPGLESKTSQSYVLNDPSAYLAK